MSKLKWVPSSEFTRHALTMVMGTGLAQLIMVVTSPLLTRLYNPEIYGTYAVFLSVVGVIGPFATGKYELAINITGSEDEARDVTALAILATIVVSVLSLVLVLPLSPWLSALLKNDHLKPCLVFVPLVIFCNSAFVTFSYWFNRKKDYRAIATAKVGSAIGLTTCAIALGLARAGARGLALSYALGQAIAFVLIAAKARRESGPFLRWERRRAYRALAGRYRKFPIFLMTGNLINSLAGQVYVFMISSFYDVATVGAISLSQTAIVLPTSLVSVSISEVFRQRASEDLRATGTCRPLLMKTIRKLALLSILPFGLLALLGPWMFGFVFGRQWHQAGVYAQIMTGYYMVRFILAPISGVVIQITERLEVEIFWQVAYLLANVLAVYAGRRLFATVGPMLVLFSLANLALIFLSFALAYRFAERKPARALPAE